MNSAFNGLGMEEPSEISEALFLCIRKDIFGNRTKYLSTHQAKSHCVGIFYGMDQIGTSILR